jgi:excisionase family DNA binding protein
MPFIVPPLPGEHLLTPKEVARRAGCHVTAIYRFIKDGKLAAVTVADRQLITESEAERFIQQWPSSNRGVSARWRDYRAWKAGRSGTEPAGEQT